MQSYAVIGKSFPNVDSPIKVRGAAVYAGDIKMPGMLIGKILRSPHAHARIVNIDTTKARNLVGVKAVLTGKDTLGIHYGFWRVRPELLDEQGLVTDKVRYIGDPVAAVAAVDEDTAEEALRLIQVEYDLLPMAFTLEEAMREGAPVIHDSFPNNINVVRKIDIGDVDAAFKQCDYVREDRFETQAAQHCSMEPHVCVAEFDDTGKLTLWDSTQSAYFTQVQLAETLGLRENDVRVVKVHTGGGFGNKVEFFANEFCASLLAKHTRRPVKLEFTRKEEFMTTRRRVPETIIMKTGVTKDGMILARESTALLDGGAYNSQIPTTTMLSGMFGLLPYRIPNYRYLGRRVYTNNMPSGAMRGHGGPQPNFASEVQLDLIAKEIGIDPLDLRLKNAMQPGDGVPGIAPEILTCGMTECLEKLAEATDWRNKRKNLPPGKGIGLSCYGFVSGGIFNWFKTKLPFSEVQIKLNEDGTVNLYTRAMDVGQGSNTVLSQILAEELGIEFEDVRIVAGDTETTVADLGAWASRQTLQTGNAVRKAALEAKRQLFVIAREKLDLQMHEVLEARGRRIYVKGRPDRGLPFAEVALAAQKARGGMPLMARGAYTPRDKGLVSSAWSFGAQAVELEVDGETGVIRYEKVTTAHDGGKAINPALVEGQLQGSAQMSLGWAYSENLLFDQGRVLNPNFRDYKVLTAADMPAMESIMVETCEPEGPYGAKEAGEGLTLPTGGAVANAVFHATGFVVRHLPVKPEDMVESLEVKK